MMLWQCPHPREFLDSIFEQLQKGDQHMVIHLPYWRMDEFKDAVYNTNKRYNYSLDFPLSMPEASPYEYLAQSAIDPENFSRDNLMEQAMSKENIFLIMPPDCSEERQQEWLDFMDNISAESRNYQERHLDCQDAEPSIPLPWRLLLLVPSHFASPRPETSMEIFLGSGLTRQSDLEYAIESCNDESRIRNTSSRLWLDSICQGLGTRDVSLCAHIFKKLPLEEEEILEMLRDYPFAEMGKDLIASVISVDDGSCQYRNNFHLERQKLLDYGILERDCRNVESLHPAALARANRRQAISRLLLQGQIRTYLPLVQEVQTFIHSQLGQLCGADWHKKDPEKYPGIDMDIGPLASYMSTYLKGDCGEDLLELAWCWRDVRHHLAHGRLISFEKSKEAVERYESLRRNESQFF